MDADAARNQQRFQSNTYMNLPIGEIKTALKPWIYSLMDERAGVVSPGASGFAPSPHDLIGAHHSGLLADSQATQFLKTDGTRPLAGNLAVDAGITIDGVDISALAAGVAVGANPTASVGLAAVNGSAATFMRSDGAPALSVAIVPTWTGKHTFPNGANAPAIPDFTAATHTHLTAATGGTLSLGAGVITSGQLALARGGTNADLSATGGTGQYLKQASAGAAISVGTIPGGDVATGFTLGSVVFAGAAGVLSQDNANLFWDNTNKRFGIGTAAPAYNLSVSGTLGVTGTLSATSIGSHLIPSSADVYDLGSCDKPWRAGHISSQYSTLFVQNVAQLFGGYLIVTKDSGTFAAIVNAADVTINFGKAMTPNDIVCVRALDNGGAAKTEYIQCLTLVSGTTYNVTRDLAAAHVTDPVWPMGTAFAVFGTTGNGRIEVNATTTPRLSIFRKTGTAYNAESEYVRIGDINGLGGAAVETYGFYAGDGTNYIRYDPLTTPNFQIKAGGGNVAIDADGISVALTTAIGSTRAYNMKDGAGNVLGSLEGYVTAPANFTMLTAKQSAGRYSRLALEAQGASGQDANIQMQAVSNNSATLSSIYIGSDAGINYVVMHAGSGSFNGLTIGTFALPNAMLDVRGSGIVTGGLNVGTATGAGTGRVHTGTVAAYTEAFGSTSNPAVQIKNLNSAAFHEKAELQFIVGNAGVATAVIAADYSGWTAPSNTGSDLVFLTKDSAGAAVVERMRIAATGLITLGGQPAISDLTNAQHAHTSAATGGALTFGNPDKGARVYHSTTQATSNNVWFAVAFDSERWDTDAIHDTVTNNGRLTCKTAGKYLISGNIQFASVCTPIRMRFKLNASTSYIAYTNLSSGYTISMSTIYDLAVNDYVTMEVYQNSGAINLTGAPNYGTEFMMQRIAG